MSEAVQSPRRFTEGEVQQLFRRAAELQRRDIAAVNDVRALSLEELERIAADAGIDVGQIHRAIAELDSRKTGAGSPILGAPGHVHFERLFDGEIPSSALETLATEIRRSVGATGQVSVLGGTWTWTAQSTSSGPVEVTISRAAGQTLLGLNARFGGLMGATFGAVGGGLGGGLGGPLAVSIGQLTQSGLAAAGTALATVGLAFLLARSIYAGLVRKRVRVLQELFTRLADQAGAAAVQSKTQPSERSADEGNRAGSLPGQRGKA